MTRLVVDHSAGARAVSVSCLKGDGMVKLADAVVDLDGPAFQAYYHAACAPAGDITPNRECELAGCTRSECKAVR